MEYKIELATLDVKIKGKKKNKKKEIVNYYTDLAPEKIRSIFDIILSEGVDFDSSAMDIDPKISKKFQAVGIENCFLDEEDESIEGGVYRFLFRLIYREQSSIWITTTPNEEGERTESQLIEILGDKYQSIPVCVSYYAHTQHLVVGSKSTLGALSNFFRQLFAIHLNISDFDIPENEVESSINVIVKKDLQKNFEEKLNDNFQKINRMSFGFFKPSEQRVLDSDDQDSEMPSFLKKLVGKFMGQDAVERSFLNSPIQSFSVSMKVDENFDAEKLALYREQAKDQILSQADKAYMTSTAIEFESDENELEKALFHGIVQSDTKNLSTEPTTGATDFYEWHDEFYIES